MMRMHPNKGLALIVILFYVFRHHLRQCCLYRHRHHHHCRNYKLYCSFFYNCFQIQLFVNCQLCIFRKPQASIRSLKTHLCNGVNDNENDSKDISFLHFILKHKLHPPTSENQGAPQSFITPICDNRIMPICSVPYICHLHTS